MPSTLYAILNTANNFVQQVNLTAPIEENYVRVLANRQELVNISFLANGYVYDLISNTCLPEKGVALAGSKYAYTVKHKPFYNFTVEQVDKTKTDEVQLAFYFFS